jgi:hypothetical protein
MKTAAKISVDFGERVAEYLMDHDESLLYIASLLTGCRRN